MAQRVALPLRVTNPAPRRNIHTTNCAYFLAGAFGGALFACAFCFLFLSVAFGLLSPIALLLDCLRHAPARRHRTRLHSLLLHDTGSRARPATSEQTFVRATDTPMEARRPVSLGPPLGVVSRRADFPSLLPTTIGAPVRLVC